MASLAAHLKSHKGAAVMAAAAASALLSVKREESRDSVEAQPWRSPLLTYCYCDAAPHRATLNRALTKRRMKNFQSKENISQKYKMDRSQPPLGKGGFGAVHLAQDLSTKEYVAIKRIPKSMTDSEMFLREIGALMKIRQCGGHPHICALRASYEEGSDYYLVLDYVSGGEMFDHLIRSGAYSEADAARLVREVASALAFLHGIGVVHADLKPENLMLSTSKATDAVVKLVDFGCAAVIEEHPGEEEEPPQGVMVTVAYNPPELVLNPDIPLLPSLDMWSLGVILYIMLSGRHPFDLTGEGSDDDIAERILDKEFPLRDSPYTQHLSESAIELIERLMDPNASTRMTADEMLAHPWVRGETATTDTIKGSAKRLGKFRAFKSKVQAKFFRDVVAWSDESADEMKRKTNLIERSFRSFDAKNQGFLTAQDLGIGEGRSSEKGEQINMSAFHNLLSENMHHKYFPKGHVIYEEGDIGNHMYFINSGSIEVTTSDGSKAVREQGDFFGEGALLHPKKIRSATIKCRTPVHAMEISREYFDKYLASSESGLIINLREKDKIRKRNRAKTILRLQNNLKERRYNEGDLVFDVGEDGDSLFIVESGKVDVMVDNKLVFSATEGNLCGENSLLTGRARNCIAKCASSQGCVAGQMMGRDFRKLLDLSGDMHASLLDLALRRDFKKAVVYRLNKEFPYNNPRQAYDAVKGNSPVLGKEQVGDLMREMDPDFADEDILTLINTINLTNSGTVSFDEFKKVFIADKRTSASM